MPSIFDTPGSSSAPPAAPTMRAFGDVAGTRQAIYDNVLKAAQGFEPVSNSRYTLGLSDVKYSGPDKFHPRDEKQAILANRSLSRRLVGTWVLSDPTGTEIARRRMTIAQVPHLADSGTFVHNGSAWTMAHQMRLMPGVFARRKNNGELESHVNVSKGLGHRVFMDPETGVFKVHFGQANIPLYPLMRALGANDARLREAWGDLLPANMQADDPQAMRKLYGKLLRYGKDTDDDTRRNAVVNALQSMQLDPEVTRRTLGKSYSNVNADALLDITKKLVAISRGEADSDDRDHLAYQRVLGPEDVLAEAIQKSRGLARQALWKATSRGNLDGLPTGALTKALQGALLSSGLGMPLEEVNTAEIFDQQSRITRMGQGGIPSLDAVPDESRAVQPSQFGFIDFLRTPESGKVGVDARLARGARKGSDGRLYTQVRDAKSGQMVWKSPQDLADSVVAFPLEMESNEPMVSALVNGSHVKPVSRDQVNFIVPQMEDTFSPLGNMIPMKSSVKGQRAVMAARMITQALPLVNAEAPLVQSGIPGQDDKSYEDEYGANMGARRFSGKGPGRVMAVSPDGITIRHDDGTTEEVDLYNHMPFNRKTFFHQTPVVQPGDTLKPGQLLATSNFTDKNGTTALGNNARVAYIPWGGANFEDASVVSKSYAERTRSEHAYQHGIEWDPQLKRGKNAFISLFPSKYDRKTLENFDEHGVVKPGTEVKQGSPLILAAREREPRKGMISRGRGPSYRDESEVWDHHSPGVVTDVVHTDKGVQVVVKTSAALEVGDKLSGRYGDKGIIAAIVDDDEMPHDTDGKPFEVLLNPAGINTRTNPAQIAEAALGKIAALRGKPYKIPDFGNEDDRNEFVMNELAKAGVSPREDVIDPRTGQKIPNVYTGNRWMMKLHHTAESKNQGRGLGEYTMDEAPAKGGPEGAKRVGMLELNALLSHGATENVRDISLVRGQANPAYWTQTMSGFKPPTPEVPKAHRKFVDQLRGAGINVVRDGNRVHIMAMTNKDLDNYVGDREIKNAETVDWKDMLKPVKGGLFDETLTGGPGGNRWSYIALPKPLPSPVMEEPIRRLLNLTEPKFKDILSGKETLGGKTGPEAIGHALDTLDVGKELARCREDIKSGKKTARDQAIRKLKYLKSAERLGQHPRDWMLSKIPVLPPAIRGIATMGPKKLPLVDDANHLYKEAFEASQVWKDMDSQIGDSGEEQLAAYNAFKAVTGLGDPIQPKNQERQVKGILKHVFGSSPKTGAVQYRLLGRSVDLVGRSVIAPDPDLDMDSVGIPEARAWAVYRPFVIRNLVRRGMPRLQAARAVEARSQDARQMLLAEMEKRPVIINRAPTLHRYGMMAAWPKLVKGDVLKLPPLVVKGFNADFDGDAMSYHVPGTDEAAQEAAEKMLPSRNLFAVSNFKIHQAPMNEYIGGLYEASAREDKKSPPLVFTSKADAIKAYQQGRIGVDRQVHIIGEK